MSLVQDVRNESAAKVEAHIEQIRAEAATGERERVYQSLMQKESSVELAKQHVASLEAEVIADRAEVSAAYPDEVVAPVEGFVQG